MVNSIKLICLVLLLSACEDPRFKQITPNNVYSISKTDQLNFSISEFGMDTYEPWKIYLLNPQGLVSTNKFSVERETNTESNKTGVFVKEYHSGTNFSLGFNPEGWYLFSIINWDGKGISNAEGVSSHLVGKGFTLKKISTTDARTQEILIKPAKDKNRFLICRLTRQENGAINTMSFQKLEYK
jgi:hypothetical protein